MLRVTILMEEYESTNPIDVGLSITGPKLFCLQVIGICLSKRGFCGSIELPHHRPPKMHILPVSRYSGYV